MHSNGAVVSLPVSQEQQQSRREGKVAWPWPIPKTHVHAVFDWSLLFTSIPKCSRPGSQSLLSPSSSSSSFPSSSYNFQVRFRCSFSHGISHHQPKASNPNWWIYDLSIWFKMQKTAFYTTWMQIQINKINVYTKKPAYQHTGAESVQRGVASDALSELSVKIMSETDECVRGVCVPVWEPGRIVCVCVCA